MSLQGLWALYLAYPGRALNLLALFVGFSGAWLWLATRWRELRHVGQAVPLHGNRSEVLSSLPDARTQRVNRFFYQFGSVCLAASLLLSWFSTRV